MSDNEKLKARAGREAVYSGMKVLVMGLGLNGGGLESARYLALKGADISVTDLRDEKILAPSIKKLEAELGGRASGIHYILGRHETRDFEKADLVIKNPGVRPDSPYLLAARRVETDISLFLAASPARLTAVTGSKGKSTISSALYHALGEWKSSRGGNAGRAYLGGNITLSPLSFLDELEENDDVVLELSSWQLGDLKGRNSEVSGEALLKPRAAVISAIMPDHMDRYNNNMEAYVADKRIIYQGQDEKDATISGDDSWGQSFRLESRGRPLVYGDAPIPGVPGGWIDAAGGGRGLARLWEGCAGYNGDGKTVEIVPAELIVAGKHQKKNLLASALALLDLGVPAEFIRDSLARFPGAEHRLEFFHEKDGVRFYNDSAATIPEAAAAAIRAFGFPPVLVTGGTDKNLDFSSLAEASGEAKALILIAGSGTEKLIPMLKAKSLEYSGPFNSLDDAVKAALSKAASGDALVLSPGCTSFGMFLNEFDRGLKWKEAVRRLAPV